MLKLTLSRPQAQVSTTYTYHNKNFFKISFTTHLQPSFSPFYSTITFQVNLPTTRTPLSLCCHNFACVKIKFTKFPVFSLFGKVNIQIPCFPCAMAILCMMNLLSDELINYYHPQKFLVTYRMNFICYTSSLFH